MNLKRYLCFFLVIAMMLTTVMPAAATEPESAPVIIEGDAEIITDETPDEPSEEPSEEPTEEITDEISDETSDETEEEPSEEPTEGGENEIAPVAEESVAKVGEAQYNTLAAAIEVAKSGDTITLLADVTEDVTVSKSVTIDGAGKTYTGKMTLTADTTIKNVNFDGKGYNGYAVETRGADYLTIEDCTAKNYGYGFVQLASGTALTTVKNVTVSNMNYGVKVDYSNAVVLENVKLDCAVAGVLNSNYGEKTITIKDSDISILGTWTRNNTTKTKVVFEGTNSIDKFIIDAAIDTFVLAKDATLTAPNEITLTTEDGNIVYANGSYAVVEKTYAAQVGEEKYETLADAVAAANEAGDATIVLLSDVTLGEKLTISGNVTISGEYTITRDDAYTGTLFTVNAGATLTLDGGLVIDGGNNYAFDQAAYKANVEDWNTSIAKDDSAKWFTPEAGAPVATAFMFTTTGGTINLNNVTVQNNYSVSSGVVSVGANSTINLTGAKITHVAATQGSGVVVNASGAGIKVNMNAGTVIDGNHVGGNHGIFKIYSGAVLTMNGGEVKNTTGWNSNGVVVGVYWGTFNMKGGLICSNTGVYGPSNGRNAAIYLHSGHNFEMTGGTICHNSGRARGGIDAPYDNGTAKISGGEVLDNISRSNGDTPDVLGTSSMQISGGTFTQDVSKWLTPDTGLVYNEETGKYNTTDHIYNLYFRDPATGEQLPYVGPLQGNDMASLVATGKSFYANYYKMELEVLSNVKIDKTVVIDYPMTINLNGKTISATSDVDPVFRVEADVTVTGNGKIDARNGIAYAFILGKTDGTAGNLTIENGTFYGETTVASVTNGTLTINGGQFAVNPYKVEGEEDNYNFLLNCIDANYRDGSAKIVVNGGVFFKFDPSNNAAEGAGTNFCADGYIAEELKTNYWTVRAVNYVAQVGEVMYESLKEALEACTNGETVKLIADITYGAEDVVYAHGGATGFGNYDQYNPSIIYIGGTKGATAAENQPSNVNAVLDLNGHSITSTADAYLFLIMDNAKVTFIDNVGDGQVYNQSANYPAIWSVGTETLVTISGGSYLTNSPYGLLHVTHSGDLVITGGSFKTNATDASLLIMLNSQKYNNPNYFLKGVATVSIKGGTFYGFNPEKVGDDYGATSIEDIKFVDGCAENYAPVDNGDGTYGVKYDPSYGNVAKLGDTYYKTLQAAVDACVAGENTITLLADVTEDVTVNKSVTINGADKTYTGKMTLKADTTIKNVNFDGNGYNGYAVETRGADYLTIEDCTAKNYGYGFVQLASGTALTTVKNVTVSNMNYGVKVDYSNAVVLENVKLDCAVAGVLNSNYGSKTITIKNSDISILGTWTRNNTIKTTYVFEGENSIGEFIIDAAIDNFKLAADATLTAPEEITVTTDVDGMKVAYEEGAYKLVKAAIAAIGKVQYSSLQAAVDAANAGQTIKLLCHAEGPGVVIDKSININFGGYTYTFTEGVGSTGTESNGFQILKGNTVKLTDGTLKVADSAADKFYILIQNYSDLTVQRITLDGTNLDKWSKTDGDSYVLSNNSGYVQIKAGTKFIVNNDGDKAFAFDVCDQTDKGYDPPTVKLEVKVDKKYIEAAAYTGSYYYATLQQAVNAGGTITVLRNLTGPGVVIKNDININFGGYTYSLNKGVGSTGTESNGFQILKGNTVVMRNGTVKVAESAADKFYILLQNYADLSTANLTLDGTYLDKYSKTDGDSYVVSNNSGNVSIGSGTTITANDDGDLAFAFDACDKSAWGYELPVVTVHKNATIEGNIEAAAKIGNVYYASLSQAIEAADGKTITVLKNIDLADEKTVTLDDKYNTYFLVDGKTVTIDLNGKTISGEYNGESMLVGVFSTDNGGNLTLTGNGTVDVTANSTVYGLVVNYEPGCHTTIENGTFTLDKASDSLIYTGGDEDITVKGGTFTLGNVGTGENGSPWIFNAKGKNTASVTVTGGTFNANVALQYWAHEVDIEDGNGNLSYIIDNKNGTWTVSGKPAEAAIMVDVVGNYDLLLGYVTVTDALAAAKAGQAVLLMKDVTVEKSIGITGNRNVVIDLNGHTLSSAKAHVITCYYSNTTITIKDSVGGGKVLTTGSGKHAFVVQSNLVIDGAEISSDKGGNAIVAQTAKANVTIQNDAVINGKVVVKAGAMTITGGTINDKLEITDGVTVEISAGYFKHPVKAEWCAEGYIPTEELANGYYSVTKSGAAKIGETYYETLAAAIADAKDGDTVTVLKNIGLANVETVLLDNAYNTYFKVEGKSVTVDLNGKVISGTYGDTSTMLVGVFSTDNNGHLTLTGNGTVNVDVAEGATVYSLLANYEEGCTITVKNGSYTLSKAHDCLLYTGGDEGMLVDGGTFFLGNVGEGQNGKPWIFNTLGANDRHAFVTGGSFNADVSNQYWKYEVQFPADRIVVKEGEMYKVIQYVEAMIGETGYASLAAAIEEAKTGDVITLNMDVAVDTSATVTNSGGYATIYNVAEKAITIDLNGKKIHVTANAADVAGAKNAMLLGVFAVDTNGSLTLTGNGTVTANAVDASMTSDESHLYSLMIAYGAGSKLVVENGTYYANSVSSALVYSQYDEIVTINGGSFTLGNVGTDANGSPWLFNAKGQNTANIKVNGGTFCADIQHQHYPFEVMMPKEKALSKDSEGMYTVVDAVAYVTEREWSSAWYTNEVGYATLEEAIAACEGPKTKVSGKNTYTSEQEVVVLLTNIVLEGKLDLPENAVLDWNGHTITQNNGTETSNNVVPVTDAATLIEAVVNGDSAVLTNPIEVPENTEFLIEASKEIEFNGSGNTITTKGTGTKPGESYNYGYVGFIPANGEDAVVSNVKVVGSGFVEVGHHGVSTGGNYSITKLVIENLIATLAVNNGGNNIAAAFSHYGNATMTNCVMTGTTTAKEGYKPYDAAFVNGTNTVIDRCKFDKVYVANQAHVTITNTEIEEIDSCAITTRDLGMLTIGAGAKIGTINLNPGKYTPAIVIEEGAEVGAIVYNGVTYTVDQWLAR